MECSTENTRETNLKDDLNPKNNETQKATKSNFVNNSKSIDEMDQNGEETSNQGNLLMASSKKRRNSECTSPIEHSRPSSCNYTGDFRVRRSSRPNTPNNVRVTRSGSHQPPEQFAVRRTRSCKPDSPASSVDMDRSESTSPKINMKRANFLKKGNDTIG